MAGFWGLFGGKTKYVDEPTPERKEPGENEEAFFLEPDQAKTLGNVEFMRQKKTIKRTFPKTLKGKGKEIVQDISSLESKRGRGSPGGAKPAVTPENQPAAAPRERRTADSTMDQFRRMAREIQK